MFRSLPWAKEKKLFYARQALSIWNSIRFNKLNVIGGATVYCSQPLLRIQGISSQPRRLRCDDRSFKSMWEINQMKSSTYISLKINATASWRASHLLTHFFANLLDWIRIRVLEAQKMVFGNWFGRSFVFCPPNLIRPNESEMKNS